MYYFNLIILYSFLGFALESFYFKYIDANEHSSIFTGPITLVYGFGMLLCLLIYNSIPNTNIFIYYILFSLATSLIEYIGGHIIHIFLKIDKWDYSNFKYHFGKYICLKNSLIWGLLSTFIIIYIHPYLNNNLLLTIPNNFSFILLIIFIIDLTNLIIKIIKIRCRKNN